MYVCCRSSSSFYEKMPFRHWLNIIIIINPSSPHIPPTQPVISHISPFLANFTIVHFNFLILLQLLLSLPHFNFTMRRDLAAAYLFGQCAFALITNYTARVS